MIPRRAVDSRCNRRLRIRLDLHERIAEEVLLDKRGVNVRNVL